MRGRVGYCCGGTSCADCWAGAHALTTAGIMLFAAIIGGVFAELLGSVCSVCAVPCQAGCLLVNKD
jgi:hypothetical protein